MRVITKFQNNVSEEDRSKISEAIDTLVEQGIRYNKTELQRITWISEAVSGRNFEGLASFTIKN